MLLNDTEKDLRHILVDTEVSIKEAAERAGLPRSYVHKVMERSTVDQKFVDILDGIGYDVKILYVKKEK